MSFFWRQHQAMTLPLTGQHTGCSWEAAPEPARPPTLESWRTVEPPATGSYLAFGLCLDQDPIEAPFGVRLPLQQMDREKGLPCRKGLVEEVLKLGLAPHLLWALESRARGWGPGRLHSPDDLLQTGGHGQEGSSCPGLQRLCFLVRWRQSQGVSSAHDFTPPEHGDQN